MKYNVSLFVLSILFLVNPLIAQNPFSPPGTYIADRAEDILVQGPFDHVLSG